MLSVDAHQGAKVEKVLNVQCVDAVLSVGAHQGGKVSAKQCVMCYFHCLVFSVLMQCSVLRCIKVQRWKGEKVFSVDAALSVDASARCKGVFNVLMFTF